MNFDYLLEKIKTAPFRKEPFKHIYIEDFFNQEDFKNIVSNSELKLKKCENDEELFLELFKNNYKVIEFPACTTDYKEYIKKHSKGIPLKHYNNTCESEGVTLRLNPKSSLLTDLNKFFLSEEFNKIIAEKLDIDLSSCIIDAGIQKYLDQYEISPHPDIRKKAATYMININPSDESENFNFHTQYLKLKPEYSYVKEFWKGNKDAERMWVPWNWCTTEFSQSKNNSIVIFSPSDDTMHGVKADYQHYLTQRTQIYGNLWYSKSDVLYSPRWEQIVVNKSENFQNNKNQNKSYLINLYQKIKTSINKFRPKDPNVADRKKVI